MSDDAKREKEDRLIKRALRVLEQRVHYVSCSPPRPFASTSRYASRARLARSSPACSWTPATGR